MLESLIGNERLDYVLRANAQLHPDAPMLIYRRGAHAGTEITWAEADRHADAIGAFMRTKGVGVGARCVVILSDHPSAVITIYALMRAGIVVVPIDPLWGSTAVASIIGHAEPSFLICEQTEQRWHDLMKDEALVVRFDALPKTGGEAPADRNDPDELALLAFTSGTTSDPKGVCITHRQICAAYRIGADAMAMTDLRRAGCVFRLAGLGVLGICYFFPHLHGATTVILPELNGTTAPRFWQSCNDEKIDFVYVVPALLQFLNRLSEPPPPDMRRVQCAVGAAPLSQDAFDTFRTSFGLPLRNIYGLTELTFAILFGDPGDDGLGLLTIGDGGAVGTRLIGEAGEVVTGPGEGELQILSPSACSGYWRNDDATRALFTDDGWMHSGDLVRRDAAGNYHVIGRLKDVVLHGGFSIYLAEVDEALLGHGDVLGASSIGWPDKLYGEVVLAAVQFGADARTTEQELLLWARERLGIGRAPKRIFVFENGLPVNGQGKVVRRLVKAEISRMIEGSL